MAALASIAVKDRRAFAAAILSEATVLVSCPG